MATPSEERPLAVGNGGSRPVPDPTELTDRAISRLERSLLAYIDGQFEVRDERLRGIDEATKLRLRFADNLPDDIASAVSGRAAVVDEKFRSVDQRFQERDTRSERESRDNKVAVDAAFAAQKEAAAKQDEANAKAIDKSEKATAETIKTNQELTATQISALTKGLDEVKLEVRGLTALKTGATENRTGIYATVGLVVTIAFFLIALIGFVATRLPPTT